MKIQTCSVLNVIKGIRKGTLSIYHGYTNKTEHVQKVINTLRIMIKKSEKIIWRKNKNNLLTSGVKYIIKVQKVTRPDQ